MKSGSKKENLVKKLFKMLGTEETAKKVVASIIRRLLDSAFIPDSDDKEEAEIFLSEINKIISEKIGDLTSLLTTIYCKHFTYRQLQELLLFYQSEIGEKLILLSSGKEMTLAIATWEENIKPILEERIDKAISKFEDEKDKERQIKENVESNFSQLKMFFWQSLTFEQRNAVLSRSKLLPEGCRERLPQTLEHNALMSARANGKLYSIWDDIMSFLPEEKRKPNPFKKEINP